MSLARYSCYLEILTFAYGSLASCVRKIPEKPADRDNFDRGTQNTISFQALTCLESDGRKPVISIRDDMSVRVQSANKVGLLLVLG